MAAQQQEDQRVITVGVAVGPRHRAHLCGGIPERDPVLPGAPSVLAADLVDQTARRHRDQPGPRVLRHALFGPRSRRRREGLLRRILAEVQGLVASEDGAQDLRRQLPQQVLDADRGAHRSAPGSWRIGQTSTALNDGRTCMP